MYKTDKTEGSIRRMKTVRVVQPEEAALARKMEAKLMELPPSSGILFVGVSVSAATDQHATTFNVWVGCHRDFDEALFPMLVQYTLRYEIEFGARVVTQAHRGISRAPLSKVVDGSP